MERETKVEQVVVSSYLDMVFDSPRKLIRHLAKVITKSKLEFDTIAFRGMSGALVAPTLAYVLNKHLLVVRKDGETTHSCHRVEGNANARKVLIVDDFISSGSTVQSIIDGINKNLPRPDNAPPVEFVGIVGYKWRIETVSTKSFWLDGNHRIKLPVWEIGCSKGEIPVSMDIMKFKPEITVFLDQ